MLSAIGNDICADPTLNGGKGQLRVLSANNEPFTPGMPLLYFAFYQGYANEKITDTSSTSERTLSNTTDYSEFFVEYSSDNLSGSNSEQRLTPGIRLNPGKGITLTFALDKTFSSEYPDKRLNTLFSWLGPFSVFGAAK